ncbi:ABC transporter substrate-binding protein [Phaeobacter gallaeciensis]|jgi:putative spermidine/putrescine transport system substrate-binding protein|uniref:ABC transporter substrate-binding protein n=1 Tax=Phaeobacter gallaeciensis TaxID=60890 RepID=UPI00237FC514|nr:ABC transporter substrate-binding protein [Phaeobacter gallaeciensis]MDE4139975.1 ABC transporter substrate-binding protein [Phaeobacter gallaeciensis]MDE4148415.1 ABC transporter substrate-binding protein [Phaeobacter gallaeciensis]MDE4152641.1 ABC transporter substrate-binding protein [Phaeobacter gallaeciensis]MDE4228025.1 ABC transporter substrate-binding protein [Phaeobacter gallaeciensis]MDE4257106.1 ABC transporter substrate-binding protein [Phaeobacter gallaeciensis]
MTSFLKSCTALVATAVVASQSLAADMITEIGPGEGQVNIVAWPGYIERGETVADFDWVTKFEEATSCKVNVKTANTSDEMVALMNEGGFDLVTASGDASLRMIAGKRVQPVNIDLIPSWPSVDDRLKEAPWHYVGGVHYGTPYMWGPNVLMYSTEAFAEAPTSWSVVFEETTLADGKSNQGRVQAYDGPIHIADAANYLMYHKPELGITSPYELNQEQYDAALDLLRVQRGLVSRYWHDAFIQIDDFKNEGIVASGSWPFQVNLLQGDGAKVASTIPQEGATGWADTTMMHAEAENPNCAYMWMEHTLSSNLQSDLSVWFGANPAVPAACTDGRGMQTAEGCTKNGMDDFERIKFWQTPVSKCESQGTCVPYYRWVSDYIGVIGGR